MEKFGQTTLAAAQQLDRDRHARRGDRDGPALLVRTLAVVTRRRCASVDRESLRPVIGATSARRNAASRLADPTNGEHDVGRTQATAERRRHERDEQVGVGKECSSRK